MIRVVVVDDQALIRVGLRVLLEGEQDVELAGEAEDGAAAIDLVRRRAPTSCSWTSGCPAPTGSRRCGPSSRTPSSAAPG